MPDTFAHYSRAYGLTFASDMALPFPAVDPTTPDVTVRYGEVPKTLGEGESGRFFWTARPDAYLMNHDLTGSALAIGGREVIIGRDSPDIVRVFLTGSVLTALLQQRGLLTLHGSAVEVDGKAVALLGKSGAGKSTTATALMQRGCRFITDDVVALRFDATTRAVSVVPAYPTSALWLNAFDKLDLTHDEDRRRLQGVDKFLVPIDNFREDELPLGQLVFLEQHTEGTAQAQPMAVREVFHGLTTNVHRRRAAMAMGLWPSLFQAFCEVAEVVPGIRVQRPRTGDSLACVVDAILAGRAPVPGSLTQA